MHHAVVGGNVCHGDLGVVDKDAVVVDGHGDIGAVESGDHLAITQIRAERGGAHNVIQQDVCQFRQGKQVFGGGVQRASQCNECVVRGGEYRERSFTTQRACQVGFKHRSFKHVVDRAVDHDVHDGVGGRLVSEHRDASEVSCGGGVVMVGAWDVEVDGANASAKKPKTVCRGQREGLGIVERLAGVHVGDAIHIVGATEGDEFNAFACVNGEVVGCKPAVAGMDGVVAMTSPGGAGRLGMQPQSQPQQGQE